MHAKKTAFVVEHDFIMATYLADRYVRAVDISSSSIRSILILPVLQFVSF